NEDGTMSQKLSYDAWGLRRNIDGSEDVSNSINAPVSRGYTIGKSRLLHKNLLMLCYEKILLMSTLTYRGDYPATSPAVRNGVLRAFLVQEGLMLPVTSEANLVNSALRTFNIHARLQQALAPYSEFVGFSLLSEGGAVQL